MPLKTGVYFIKNVQAKNLAYLPNPDSEEPVQCRYHRNDPGEQWEVIDRKNGQHSIVNIGHKTYATSGFRSPAGTPVVGRQSEQTWIIQKANEAGQYTISTTDTQKFWGVVDIQLGTPITLADVPTNPFNRWTFEDVKTGIDAEVATDDTVSRAVFLLELAPPPISPPKSYKLDLVVIQETPNIFIRSIIETVQKICRPLISSGQLDPSDLLIQGIEFESFQKAHRFRHFGPDSFEKLRHYQGVDWTKCPGPVIPTFLTKGLNGFRPSAMKVVVLNLRYIPLQSGGELLSQVIRKLANEDVIMVLTLSEPHLPNVLFDTELVQELARASTSIHSLPVDGSKFYSRIVDYLQVFDIDSIKEKFPDVAAPKITLTQRPENMDDPAIYKPSNPGSPIQETRTKPSTSLPSVASPPGSAKPGETIDGKPSQSLTSLPSVASPPGSSKPAKIIKERPTQHSAPLPPVAPSPGSSKLEEVIEEGLVILRVQVLGCTKVRAMNIIQGTSDPYVVVSFLNNSHKTSVARHTVSPAYAAEDATFDFPISLSLTERLDDIKFVIWDKGTFDDRYLGETALPPQDWFKEREFVFDHPMNKPFPLRIISKRVGMQAAGKVRIKLGIAPTSPNNLTKFAEIYGELVK